LTERDFPRKAPLPPAVRSRDVEQTKEMMAKNIEKLEIKKHTIFGNRGSKPYRQRRKTPFFALLFQHPQPRTAQLEHSCKNSSKAGKTMQ
jgi:hypothetical protein